MSPVVTFKCPCCGGYLEFEPTAQKFRCQYCGQLLSEDELREQSQQREEAAEAQQAEEAKQERSAEGLRSYNCSMCGAEIVTDATTAATRCYFCHSPVVLHDRLDDDFRPDGVIPFKLSKEQAREEFTAFVKKKTFIDKSFFDEGQLEMFSGVYYPYWYFDVEGDAEFNGEGTRRSVATTASYIITTTRFFRVRRRAKMAFRNIARKALNKVDGKLADGIHPFSPEDVQPYASGYLSGFLAEKRDLEEKDFRDDVLGEVKGYAGSMIKSNHTFHTLNGSSEFRADKVDARYVLLPAWVLTWKGGKDGTPYYYMMNGRSGRICGKLPINKAKLWSVAAGVGAVVFALLCAGGKFIW
ncbi:MAG: TFIIB-type zinc ribbon-containing protein [Clostridiales bacterium]|nr:TFIIB-type zinc ribbon-containing protein [Clostridiales bacterium]